MKKLSNRHLINLNKIKNPVYNIGDALNLLKETSTAKFLETVELHVNLNINPKYPDQQLRATVILPHGTGKKIKIAALVAESEIKNAKEAGAELVDSDQLLDNIGKGLINFDVLIVNGLAHKGDLVKIMGRGELKGKLNVTAHAFTATAKAAIEAMGGTANII
mgnify:CR=1 FL=1